MQRQRRRRSKRIWYVILGVFIAVFLFSFLAQRFKNDSEVDAASTAGFDPGYIISDYQMSNYNSMSEADIQRFLTSKNSCPNTNYNYYLSLSANGKYTWHWANGHFVCLSEERFGDGEVIGSGDTAAHIIWQAAQDYRINPQVLIVLLQKETSLITDPIPNNGDYRKATGYGCPDTAPCSSQYYGFKNQVRKAAALFRTVLDGGWTNYPLGNNYVQYNPNAACGGSVVNIRSLATSALYRYTPYQPNAGALAAGHGTAYCGAYGNRNFYLYFEDWFGGITNNGVIMKKSSEIIEGEYIILSNIDDGKAISINREEVESLDNPNIRIEDNDHINSQKWIIKKNGDETYTIINPTTGKALDVQGASVIKGANVQLYQSNGTCAQKWHIVENDDKTFSIYSSCSGLALDLSGGVANSGANINIWRVNGSDAQKWKFDLYGSEDEYPEEGVYSIASSINNDKVVDIAGGVNMATLGTNIQLWRDNKTAAQQWSFRLNNDGTYTIVNNDTNKAIDVSGASLENGANLQLWRDNGTCAQKWYIEKDEDEYYVFKSACSELVIDASGGVANDGTNINLWRRNGSDAQKWKLKRR